MNLKIGDKVRPLNEVGEGLVVSIDKNDGVQVRGEDGFEMPYPKRELVKVYDENDAQEPVKIVSEEIDAIELEVEEDNEEWENDTQPVQSLLEGVYLAYELTHPKHFSNSALGFYLVNNTAYDLQYNILMNAGGAQRSIAFDKLSANNVILLEKIAKTAIEAYCTVTVQLLFNKNASFQLRQPFSDTIKIKPAKLYNLSGFIKNNFTDNIAFFAPVLITDALKNMVKITPDIALNIEKAILGKEKKQQTILSKKHFRNSELSEREVDLHIEELVDNSRGMSNGEIVQVQLNHFQRELDSAIAQHLHKIVFIHGVGTGKLKNDIHQILKSYTNIRFHDASYGKYGFGATEVIIK